MFEKGVEHFALNKAHLLSMAMPQLASGHLAKPLGPSWRGCNGWPLYKAPCSDFGQMLTDAGAIPSSSLQQGRLTPPGSPADGSSQNTTSQRRPMQAAERAEQRCCTVPCSHRSHCSFPPPLLPLGMTMTAQESPLSVTENTIEK